MPTHWCCQLTKFEPCPFIGLACSLERVKRGANFVHVPCTHNEHPRSTFLYCVVMPLPSCANVPSLVLLAQKISNSEDPTFKKLYPSGTCCLCRSSPVTKAIKPSHGGYLPTKFEPNPSIGFACSLGKIKRVANSVHVPSTCNVHPGSTFYVAW